MTDINQLFAGKDNLTLENILDSVGIAVCVATDKMVFKAANKGFAGFYNLTPEELLDKSAFEVYPDFKSSVFYEGISHTMKTGETTTRMGYSNNVKKWMVVRTQMMENRLCLVSVSFIDEKFSKLGYVPHYDSLTSLPNRFQFEEDIKKFKVFNNNCGLVLLDISHFNQFNKNMGFASGDICLMEVAARIKRNIPFSDRLYRISGDQFLLISCGWKENSLKNINQIKEAFSEAFVISGKEFLIDFNMGFCYLQSDEIDHDSLKRTELALSYAKKHKTNYAEYRPDMENKSHDVFLSKEIRDGLKNNEFELFLQPQADILDNKICGAEILVRWKKPEGYKAPFTFLPFAEETGLIAEIDKYIVARAIQMIGGFNQQDIHIPISINLSAQSISSRDIIAHFEQNMKKYGVNPEQVCIEITETSLMTDINTSKEVIGELRNLGIKIAIDDFGTGYSSMEYLVRYPSDYLKIDREFIKDMIKSDNHKTMVGNLIKLGHGLGIGIVAEGVENQEEWDILKNYNCDMVQGFFYAKPMPLADFMKEIEKRGVSDMKSSLM
jgi:diguanylate cyclase (GGDEF)-like protein